MAIKLYKSPFHVTHDEEKASSMAMRVDLTIIITREIKRREWTQDQAADYLRVTQPRISDLVNGKVEKFTLDCLFDMLAKLGIRTSIRMKGGEGQQEAQVMMKRASAAG